MGHWNPCKRREFIRHLRRLGFEGPLTGTRHEFMTFEQHRLAIPSNDEFSVPQLRFMLAEVAVILGRTVDADEWKSLS